MPSNEVAEAAWQQLRETLSQYILDSSGLAETRTALEVHTNPEFLAQVDQVFLDAPTKRSYPLVAVIQLAFKLVSPDIDATQRPDGVRGTGDTAVSGRLGKLLAEAHIPCVRDAYQNIGKNTRNLKRGNFKEFDEFLDWLNTATPEQLEICLHYVCCKLASTARPIKQMPELVLARLTFARVMQLYRTLLSKPSGGVYQQFAVASLLDALLDQQDLSESRGYKVHTKNVTASDQSSNSAADVQIKSGSQTLEAFEVTAAQWEEKLTGATVTIRTHDLGRMHIVAPLPEAERGAVLQQLLAIQEDISVVDLEGFVSTAVAALRKRYREAALQRMYELLDRIQGDVELTNSFVGDLTAGGLTAEQAE